MTKQILFIQGGGEGGHEWDARLAASLGRYLSQNYHIHFPKMPNEAEPDYKSWKAAIVAEIEGLGDGVILAGHSIGASIVIKLVCEGQIKSRLTSVFLIAAPFWHDHRIWQWDEVRLPKDAGASFPEGVPLFLYHGSGDEEVPFAHLDLYAGLFPKAHIRRLEGRNHQINDDLKEVAHDIAGLA